MHFFEETDRAGAQADALKAGDTERFLQLVRESGRSSFELLQNVCPTDRKERAVALAIGIAERFLSIHAADDTWAVRVHGGGFAGAIQAFVPISVADAFAAHMERVFGDGSCYRVSVRPIGGLML